MTEPNWRCSGCGKPSPGRVRVCTCMTNGLYARVGEDIESTTKVNAWLALPPEELQAQADGDHDAQHELGKARDAAYLERNRLVALLARLFPAGVKKTAIPGWAPEWHNCVFIDLPSGHQASWHYHDDHAFLFEGLPAFAGEWDGHTTEQKYKAIEDFCRRHDQNVAEAADGISAIGGTDSYR